jgi:hypothetical protein
MGNLLTRSQSLQRTSLPVLNSRSETVDGGMFAIFVIMHFLLIACSSS